MPTKPTPLVVLDEIQGSNYAALETAAREYRSRAGRLHLTKIALLRFRDSLLVEFADPAADAGKGNGMPSLYRVTLASADLALLGSKPVESEAEGAEKLDRIGGSPFVAVEKAVAVFSEKKQGLDLANYTIAVVREGDSVVVVFAGTDLLPGDRGGSDAYPGFEVEFDVRTLEVLGSAFVR